MSIKTVLFDLDGTLLPMDMNEFMKAYFGGISKRLAAYRYEPNALIDAIWAGTAAMVKNNGEKTNEERFWDTFCGIYGENAKEDLPHFNEFYVQDFDKIQAACGYNELSKKTVYALKEMGLKVALATNPIFPAIATQKRIAWTGLSPEDFELYTTYENSRYCKPNPKYYQEVLEKLGAKAEECLMVGNDVTEDMVAETLGMKVFLLTDCLINKDNKDISVYPHGDFNALLHYTQALVK